MDVLRPSRRKDVGRITAAIARGHGHRFQVVVGADFVREANQVAAGLRCRGIGKALHLHKDIPLGATAVPHSGSRHEPRGGVAGRRYGICRCIDSHIKGYGRVRAGGRGAYDILFAIDCFKNIDILHCVITAIGIFKCNAGNKELRHRQSEMASTGVPVKGGNIINLVCIDVGMKMKIKSAGCSGIVFFAARCYARTNEHNWQKKC